ncbi:hypothetical protein QE381_003257 [Microbacterium sp. SORGH_AS 888]|nr:hypothetical protein [Microbacterium sp. SORGH_AS_0888]
MQADERLVEMRAGLHTFIMSGRGQSFRKGVMEFVIGAVAERLRDEPCTVLSLSGSPLAPHRDDKTADLTGVDRLLEILSGVIEPAYGFRSLANFKKKFQPEFTPLWIIYPESVHLPAIALALLRCYIPGLTIAGAARLARQIRRPARPQGLGRPDRVQQIPRKLSPQM